MSYLSRIDISVSIFITEKFLYKAIKHSRLARENRWGIPYAKNVMLLLEKWNADLLALLVHWTLSCAG